MVENLRREVKILLNKAWTASSKKALKALSQTVGKKTFLLSEDVYSDTLASIPKILNPDGGQKGIVWSDLRGEVKGTFILSSNTKNLLYLASLLLHKSEKEFSGLGEENVSVIKEISNILAGFYIDSLKKIFEKNISLSTPSMSVNEHKAVEFFDMGKIYDDAENRIILFSNTFSVSSKSKKFKILTIFKRDLSESLFENALNEVKFE